MKFLILVIDTASNTGSTDEIREIDAFNAKLQQTGQLVTAAGIGSPATALLIDNRAGAEISSPSSLNGSEFYSGFWIITAESSDRAQELAFEASKACNRKVELRPFLGQ
jgi:hypothetical protein